MVDRDEFARAQIWWAEIHPLSYRATVARTLLKLLRPSRTLPEAMVIVYKMVYDADVSNEPEDPRQ